MKNGKNAKTTTPNTAEESYRHCMVLFVNNANINKKWRNSAKPLFIVMQKGYFDVCTVYICTENNADHKCQQKNDKWCNTTVHFNT